MTTLPLFPETEFQIGEVWVTKRQLQKVIKEMFPEIVERSRIHSSFNILSGSIDRKYAWHAVYGDINKTGHAEEVIATLTGDAEVTLFV